MFGAIAGAIAKNTIGKFLDRKLIDKNAVAEAEHELELEIVEQLSAAQQGQLGINLQEAAHRTIFVSGWRPFIGWTCGVSLAMILVVNPMLEWAMILSGKDYPVPQFPQELMMLILVPILGIGTLRTAEKLRGKAR